MTSGVRRTADGILLAHGVGKAVVALILLLALIIGWVMTTGARAHSAVPQAVFLDTTAAIRQDLIGVAKDARDAAQSNRAISCYMAKYPIGLCDDVVRPQQAGRPR